jgi:arsenate reductase (glutaredoxin)
MLKLYGYKGCSTCQKAKKFLEINKIKYHWIPIREQPPTILELKSMLTKYPLNKLFNTSGMDYKNLNMKEKLPKLSENEALTLLSKNGNLIKRPFVISENSLLIGFKEEEWQLTLLS